MDTPAPPPAAGPIHVAGRWARKALDDLAGRTCPLSRVLIAGEDGTGKLHIARALHWRWHPDGLAPLEVIRCAGVGEEELRAELFGRECRQVFPTEDCLARGLDGTGRGLYWPGAIERSRGGTAILARIDGLPSRVCAMLETFLDTGELVPLGGDRRKVGSCALIATARSLEAVPQGLLSRLPDRLEVPPLRERRGDAEDLFWHFAALAGVGFFPARAAAHFASLDWPGNARELRAAVEAEARRWLSAAPGRSREDLERELEELWTAEKGSATVLSSRIGPPDRSPSASGRRLPRSRGPTKKEKILACAAAVASGEISLEEVARRAGASMIYTRRLLREAAGSGKSPGGATGDR